jgi:NADP+-dependent farnesol dehydrogenase
MVDKWIEKVAVVTGASAGIGAAIFKDFAKAGITVIGLARRSERVEILIKELGSTKGKAFAYKCDVSDPKSITETFKWIESKFGVVHILVNNAGCGRNVSILDDDEESFRKMNEVIDTNIRGLTQCTREAYKLMKKSDDYGFIININSILGHQLPFAGFSMNVYPASKYAVTAITETLRQELILADNKKVRVTVKLIELFTHCLELLEIFLIDRVCRLVSSTQRSQLVSLCCLISLIE